MEPQIASAFGAGITTGLSTPPTKTAATATSQVWRKWSSFTFSAAGAATPR